MKPPLYRSIIGLHNNRKLVTRRLVVYCETKVDAVVQHWQVSVEDAHTVAVDALDIYVSIVCLRCRFRLSRFLRRAVSTASFCSV